MSCYQPDLTATRRCWVAEKGAEKGVCAASTTPAPRDALALCL